MSNCKDCGSKPTSPCFQGECGCTHNIDTECIRYNGEVLSCSSISEGTNLNTLFKNLDDYICDVKDLIGYLVIENVGIGSQFFKQVNNLGEREFRTLVSANNNLTVTQNSDEVSLDIESASETNEGIVELATQSEVNALTDDSKAVVPAYLPISSETQQGLVEIATQAEVDAGVDTQRAVVPATLNSYIADQIASIPSVPNATTTNRGIVELATDAETQTGTDIERAITPSALSSRTATETRTGILEVATQVEADALSADDKIITPAKLPIASETQEGLAEIATQAEADAGTDDQRYITPLKQKTFVDNSISTYVSNPVNLPNATESSVGVTEIATQAEVDAGTDDFRYVTPLKLETRLGNLGTLLQTTAVTVSSWSKSTTPTITNPSGSTPITAVINVVCTTAEYGYSIGDRVTVGGSYVDDRGGSTTIGGVAISWSSSANFRLNIAADVWVQAVSTGSMGDINPANWSIEVILIHT